MTDQQLLHNFIERRDQAAFEALMQAHGPMVYGVCSRILRNHHDAEDAFQATFLVLARKAASIARRELLTKWLYRVAYHTALKAKAASESRQSKEKQMAELPDPAVAAEEKWSDVAPLLDRELSRLPEKYRMPVLLCDLNGKTGKEAALLLGWPEGTVADRLRKARGLLAQRLARQGLTLSGAAFAMLLAQNAASAAVPTTLLASTAQAASALAVTHAVPAGVVSAKVVGLSKGVLKAMLVAKLKLAAAAVVIVAATGVALESQQADSKSAAEQKFETAKKMLVGAKSARYDMTVTVTGQPKQTFKSYFLAPGKYRQELRPLMVQIFDHAARKMLILSPAQKSGSLTTFVGAPDDWTTNDYFERLRSLLSQAGDPQKKDFEPLGEQTIDGKRVIGFRNDTPAAVMTAWGDAATGVPVRVEVLWSGKPRVEIVMEKFEIDVDLDESLFDLTIPADYKVTEAEVDASKPTEKDLITSFKTIAEIDGGAFPEKLDMGVIMQSMVKKFKNLAGEMAGKTEPTKEQTQEMMKLASSIGRGLEFALEMPATAEVHYGGQGVKLGTANREIFWYKPEGSKSFRVIYADLSAKDAESAPTATAAVALENASKTAAAPSNVMTESTAANPIRRNFLLINGALLVVLAAVFGWWKWMR